VKQLQGKWQLDNTKVSRQHCTDIYFKNSAWCWKTEHNKRIHSL